MKILISPAKSLDFQKPLPTEHFSEPVFSEEAARINLLLKKKSPKVLRKLMNISEQLAELNWERNQNFKVTEAENESRAAVYTFNGDVYAGLDAHSLSMDEIDLMQKELRILSGLYGLLKPLDLIQPYRLEMGTKLVVGKHKNLYSFWKKKITAQLNNELEPKEMVVNLASKEYFEAIDTSELNAPLVSPEFKDYKNGKLKIISFFAKKARGMMARHLIETKASSLDHVLSFNSEGYRYSAEETTSESCPVFIR